MSREQLLFKVEHLQKLRTAENKKREKIQTEMLEVDVEDHDDLYSILKNVGKKVRAWWHAPVLGGTKKDFENTKQQTLQMAS